MFCASSGSGARPFAAIASFIRSMPNSSLFLLLTSRTPLDELSEIRNLEKSSPWNFETSRLPVRTKPQAPRSLRWWLSSSLVAGIGCESQEVLYCDSPSQNDARRTRAPQLHRRNDPALPAFRRTVRPTLRQVTGEAWS